VYLPGDWLREAGSRPARSAAEHSPPSAVAIACLDEAERYYASAEVGLGRLHSLRLSRRRRPPRLPGHRADRREQGPRAWTAG
jgi:hypothetical protein